MNQTYYVDLAKIYDGDKKIDPNSAVFVLHEMIKVVYPRSGKRLIRQSHGGWRFWNSEEENGRTLGVDTGFLEVASNLMMFHFQLSCNSCSSYGATISAILEAMRDAKKRKVVSQETPVVKVEQVPEVYAYDA